MNLSCKESFNFGRSPIIIIGMHRSGTTMVSKVLERAGLYQGWKKDKNNESTFFIKLNSWIMRELGGRWDTPEGISELAYHVPEHVDAIEKYICDQLSSFRCIEYLSPRNYIQFRSILNIQIPWCWKDPRTTYLLDVWLRLFPDAKVIHVLRHGVDVASSLRVRSRMYLGNNFGLYKKRKVIYGLLGKRGVFVDSARCLTLDGGVSLWMAYVDEARKHREKLGKNFFEVKYEDFVSTPYVVASSLLDFCGIEKEVLDEHNLREFVVKPKGRPFELDKELKKISKAYSKELSLRGYSEGLQ